MKFAVVGAGAIGGFVGAMLSRAGEDVTLIARGANLQAMSKDGLRVRGEVGDFVAHPHVTEDLAELRDTDVAILTLKAHSLVDIAPALGSALGPNTALVCAQNGIPWWYFHQHAGPFKDWNLETADPGQIIAKNLGYQRAIGCVIYCSTEIREPGVIEHLEGIRFAIGEPDYTRSERCRNIAAAFIKAGLRCPIRTNIRHDIWVKLLGSVAFNPLSAITRGTLIDIVSCPETRTLARNLMLEADSVAKALGIDVAITIEQRLQGAESVGPHKTSMLQDVEAGRPLELEPIVGAVAELAGLLRIQVDNIRAVFACTKLLALKLRENQ
ncbi:MAG: ketopantoate reductase family protein [Pyrinomonadaceae bacterium]